jgi:large subunit ribosomal protein L17
MRHRNRRGKLGKTSAHRNMMLRNMATSLFAEERIMTTLPKAKQLRPFAEKLITLARRQDLHARRQTSEYIHDKKVVTKLFDDIAKRYADPKGGYTRIVLYRQRWGDGAQTAFIELKDAILKGKEEAKDEKGSKKKTKASAPSEETQKGKKKAKAEAAPEATSPAKKKAKPSKKSEEAKSE